MNLGFLLLVALLCIAGITIIKVGVIGLAFLLVLLSPIIVPIAVFVVVAFFMVAMVRLVRAAEANRRP